jgi:ribosomal protein S12 methylthiotransferase
VKIAEGCDYKCSFCIIPTLRGHYRSRPEEADRAGGRRSGRARRQELLLISQDTTFYGVDRGERGALAQLLRRGRRRGPRVDPAALPARRPSTTRRSQPG